MSRANPFNKDHKAIEENVAARYKYLNELWNDGSYFRYAYAMSNFLLVETPAHMFWPHQQRLMNNWRAKHGTPVRYHAEFPRVKRADQCETNDLPCLYEANQQMLRDRIVDEEIVHVMK